MSSTINFQFAPAALDRHAAAAYLTLSLCTFESLVRDRSIPQPRQLSGRRVAWVRAELDAWLMNCPVSVQLPPENTNAPKPRTSRRGPAANDSTIPPPEQSQRVGQKVA